jgi:O-antigen ligase
MVALMLCARRKMIAMIPLFVLGFLFLNVRFHNVRRIVSLLVVLVTTIAVGFYAYSRLGSDRRVEKFYLTAVRESVERTQAHGIGAVIETVRQAGFFGHGLGMATQGVHHIRAERPRIWQESGPSMLVAECGIPGLLAFLAVVVALLRGMYRALQHSAQTTEHAIFYGLAALVLANGAAGIVSAQVFGDPFVGVFLPFVIGATLSGIRLRPAGTEHSPS